MACVLTIAPSRGARAFLVVREVTLNIAVGGAPAADDTGAIVGNLTFCGRAGEPSHRRVAASVAHRVGRALLHLGSQRHGARAADARHGADATRRNVILWARATALRRSTARAACDDGPACEPAAVGASSCARGACDAHANGVASEAMEPDAECLSFTLDEDYLAHAGAYPPGSEGMTYADRDRLANLVRTVSALSDEQASSIEDPGLRAEVGLLRRVFRASANNGLLEL